VKGVNDLAGMEWTWIDEQFSAALATNDIGPLTAALDMIRREQDSADNWDLVARWFMRFCPCWQRRVIDKILEGVERTQTYRQGVLVSILQNRNPHVRRSRAYIPYRLCQSGETSGQDCVIRNLDNRTLSQIVQLSIRDDFEETHVEVLHLLCYQFTAIDQRTCDDLMEQVEKEWEEWSAVTKIELAHAVAHNFGSLKNHGVEWEQLLLKLATDESPIVQSWTMHAAYKYKDDLGEDLKKGAYQSIGTCDTRLTNSLGG
jgi:hypothetical protein